MPKIFFFDPEVASTKWTRQQLTGIPSGESLLDAGAGELRYKKYCDHLRYVSQDFAQYDGVGNNVGLQTKKWDNSRIDIISDIAEIPVSDGSFDNILCAEVLEHVPRPERAIQEFSRILNHGGRLIITAPFCSQTHFAPYHFCTGFNIYWYKTILEAHKFKIIDAQTNGNYFSYIALEMLRSPMVAKNYSRVGVLPLLLYFITLPMAGIFYALSFLIKGSDKQLTYGYHVLAEKIWKFLIPKVKICFIVVTV